jgi:hypothetical protein
MRNGLVAEAPIWRVVRPPIEVVGGETEERPLIGRQDPHHLVMALGEVDRRR